MTPTTRGPKEEYPALVDDDSVLQIGLFTADVGYHPMLPLVHAFLKHSSTLHNVNVTLYYESNSSAQYDVLQLLAP